MRVLIRSVEIFHVAMGLVEPFETSFGVENVRHTLLFKVEERGGEVGWGEAPVSVGPWYSPETVSTAWHVSRDFLIPPIVGAEIEGPEDFLERTSRVRGHRMARAGLEFALWDLKAKLEGRPLSEVIGGTKERVQVGVSVGIQPGVEETLRVVESYLERGYRRVKLKIRPGWDRQPAQAVREAHPDLRLMVDANGAYTLADIERLRALDDLDLMMIEQPLRPRNLLAHAELARHLETPLCLDESVESVDDAVEALQLDSALVLNLKPARVGGLLESLRIHDLWAGSAGRPLWVGGLLETGVGRAFLVATASLPGVTMPSDISASDRYYEEDLVEPPWTLNEDGTLSVPGRPGIGVEVVEERVEKYTVRRDEIRA